jgi:hypothetical protein
MARKLADTIQLKVRMSEALRRQMEDAAARNRRSMNAEIVARLEYSARKDQDAITELAKHVLDILPDDVRMRLIQLIGQTGWETVVGAHDQPKDQRKVGG